MADALLKDRVLDSGQFAEALFVKERANVKHTNSTFSELMPLPSKDENRRVQAVLASLNNRTLSSRALSWREWSCGATF